VPKRTGSEAGLAWEQALQARVGARLRARRLQLGLRQDEVAVALGVTRQQLDHYESAKSWVTPARLLLLAQILALPLEVFLAEGEPAAEAPEPADAPLRALLPAWRRLPPAVSGPLRRLLGWAEVEDEYAAPGQHRDR